MHCRNIDTLVSQPWLRQHPPLEAAERQHPEDLFGLKSYEGRRTARLPNMFNACVWGLCGQDVFRQE
jgi:hypothetical protein